MTLLQLLLLTAGVAVLSLRLPSIGNNKGENHRCPHMLQSRLTSSIVYSRSVLLWDTVGSVDERSGSGSIATGLTQKDYLVALRNRLFAIEEQIWLHEYASSKPGGKIAPLSAGKYEDFIQVRNQILDEYPLTKLYMDMTDAQNRNMSYAAMYIDRLVNNFNRQVPLSMNHVNQIAVLSFSGQVVNLMRGQGSVYQRLLPSSILSDKGIKRQFQHPAFSHGGKFVAFAEMHFKEQGIVRSDALVYEIPTDPKVYGTTDQGPIFDTGDLPGAPFFIRFSPDDQSLVMLCTSPASERGDPYTALISLDWNKYHRTDSLAGQAAVSRYTPRKVLTLLQGNPVFFTYTTSSAANATIVAHCSKEVEDPVSRSMVQDRGVFVLQRTDTSGVSDFKWNKISDSDPTLKWSTPICHNAGGGDSVLVIEDGYLVSKAVSRWKRGEDGKPFSKRLLKIQGQVQFLVSPDSSRAVVLQEDVNMGLYSVTVIEGEDALDPSSPSTGEQYELPSDKGGLVVAFWFSPDSSKILCLTAAGKTREDVTSQRAQFRVGLNSDMEWLVYNFPLKESRTYDTFKPTPYFMKTYVPFFSQYAQVYNPWAPDSRSFIFVTPSGLSHTPLVGSKLCLGEDKWQNQGATFGTWSRC
jgi:hypothetical protein